MCDYRHRFASLPGTALTCLYTGSTDDTIGITRRFMIERKWPGRIYYAPFKDFGSTRSLAVKLAHGCGDYLLLTDADYKWVYADTRFLHKLTHDVYRIGK